MYYGSMTGTKEEEWALGFVATFLLALFFSGVGLHSYLEFGVLGTAFFMLAFWVPVIYFGGSWYFANERETEAAITDAAVAERDDARRTAAAAAAEPALTIGKRKAE